MAIPFVNKILVVCHDAGGAEIVSAYVKKHYQECTFFCYAEGPAKIIFTKKGIASLVFMNEAVSVDKIFEEHADCVALLASVSWSSPMELDFLHQAKVKKIKTIVYLDHWVNFRERFGFPALNWENNLPDELWVGDEYAYAKAKDEFRLPVKLVPNLFFEEVRLDYKKFSKNIIADQNTILFLSEPVSEPINSFGDKKELPFTEFNILDSLLNYLKSSANDKRVIIRLHPSEPKGKYDKLIKKYSPHIKVSVSEEENIFFDLAVASRVIGVESMALVVAYLCDKKVCSFLPDPDRESVLPFHEITKINQVNDLVKFLF